MIGAIQRERATWGDPTVMPDAAVSFANESLWLYRYANGKAEYVRAADVEQCSANRGGDPASGCDVIINPYVQDGLCTEHRDGYLKMGEQ
jgi:hypothetical protein